jgi:hypothetical protein
VALNGLSRAAAGRQQAPEIVVGFRKGRIKGDRPAVGRFALVGSAEAALRDP